ncbi:MAG: ATP-dependent helicase HrpB [Meiothermus sp.]|uniref:ATP-dependent helicase HrpB n=1 Tax=Meiothermus sp. TaxID=1955249 RepID=UPI0025D912DB|nr:ATP-dependent helicase HrpB [Meiothermus sp.]MCS7057329.1 ATP-dependent helicase HrpB [Meiothermus sp.]
MNPTADPSLPIYAALPAIRSALREGRTLVLQAPPGAGKSTALPLALLEEPWLEGKRVWMLEPRRLAARNIAARMSALLNEAVGETVGYRVRFESRVGPKTRLEVLTEGLLTRRLQQDPLLEGVGLVIFDEFHERSLQTDLGLLLCREVQTLREDLRLLVMSATLDAEGLGRFLGAPVVRVEGRAHPVEVRYLASDPQGPLGGVVAAGVSRALREEDGDVLVFLPGVGEILQVQRLLSGRHPGVRVTPLYGDLPLAAQQEAILPDPLRRRVVLSTSIAETSLTIEGIRVVVDPGYSRLPRFDAKSGLTRLETVRVTRDVAEQRAGRAGRLGPGVCYRLYSAATFAQLLPERRPEILEADLAPLVLELAGWGVRDPQALDWLTPPPSGAVRQAQELLSALGALEGERLTERGRALLEWPTHPRLARLLVEGAALGEGALAADLAALLEEQDPLQGAGADLSLRLEALRKWRQTGRAPHADPDVLARVERLSRQWRARLGVPSSNIIPAPREVGRLLLLAYPDRLAQLRPGERSRYRLVGGRGVRLPPDDPLEGAPWLAVAHLDAGLEEGRVFLAAEVGPEAVEPLGKSVEVLEWDERRGELIAERQRRIGSLVLAREPFSPPLEQKGPPLCRALRREGLGLLPWTEELRQWQARVESLRRWRPEEGWPEVSDNWLLENLEGWLLPWLLPVRRREDFSLLPLREALEALLPWPLSSRLEALAPTHLRVPSGSRLRLTYFPDGSPPVLAVRLQEMFGQADTPRINEGRTPVVLHLLSPARRPVQVTQDLRSFWNTTYPELRKELRGRYPKHPWPDDPWRAEPTRGPKSR